jgi:hypothetical protein
MIGTQMRAIKKINQLVEEFSKETIDWHSVAHLSRDLNAAATAINSNAKLNERKMEKVHSGK